MNSIRMRALTPLLLLLMLCSCGGSSLKQGQMNPFPPAPTSADPWFGTAGNVLISDRTSDLDGKIDYLWIGFNSRTAWQNFLSEQKQFPQGGFLIGGVPAVTGNDIGFYFDPNTTTTAEAAIPEIMTTLDTLKAQPTATNNFSANWLIPGTIEEVR